MLLEEIIAAYTENHIKPTNNLCGQKAKLVIAKSDVKVIKPTVLCGSLQPNYFYRKPVIGSKVMMLATPT
jgi:hypothetical protein